MILYVIYYLLYINIGHQFKASSTTLPFLSVQVPLILAAALAVVNLWFSPGNTCKAKKRPFCCA